MLNKNGGLDENVIKEMRALKAQIKRMIRVHKFALIEHPGQILGFQFLVGLARGVGSVIGATLVVGAVIYILSFLGYTGVLEDFNELRNLY